MGQASSSDTTLEEQSDTLTLGFLPPSPPPNQVVERPHPTGTNNSNNMPGTGKGNVSRHNATEETSPSAPTHVPTGAPETPTRPRFLGMFRRVGSASAPASAGNGIGNSSHSHRRTLTPSVHLPHLPHPHLHVPSSLKKAKANKSRRSSSRSRSRSRSRPRGKAKSGVDARPTALDRRGPRPRQLLRGCGTAGDHYDKIDGILDRTRKLHGRGLEAAGFEYRLVPCPQHDAAGADDDHDCNTARDACPACVTRLHCRYGTNPNNAKLIAINPTNRSRYIADGIMYEEIARLCQEYAQEQMALEGDLVWVTVCDDEELGERIRCMVPRGHRLHDGEGEDADKEDRMPPQAGPLVDHSAYPPLTPTSPILLITTGKGKVRAGIFSRQHLMTTALEPATALPVVRAARKRGMRCIIPDPNCRGDRHGMETYRRSMSRVFEEVDASGGGGDIQMGANGVATDSQRSNVSAASAASCSCQGVPIYVLAHSASGAQFVRYLRDYSPSRHQAQQCQPGEDDDDEDNLPITSALISRIRAVAFTDSTHNIQWTKKDSAHKHLEDMLEGSASLYVRVEPEGSGGLGVAPSSAAKISIRKTPKKSKCSHEEEEEESEDEDDDDPASIRQAVVPRDTAGKDADTDQYWNHRFGSVRTVWAGTADHSLTNWAAQDSIWQHFDHHRGKEEKASS